MLTTKNIKRVIATIILSGLLCGFICISAVVAASGFDNNEIPAITQDKEHGDVFENVAPATSPTESTQAHTEPETRPILKPVLFPDITYVKIALKTEALHMLDTVQAAIHTILNELERPLYDATARNEMEQELERLNVVFDKTKYDIHCLELWEKKLEEYPYAVKTWFYLKDMGYSDVACAGIMGNLMAECGGHTLNLDPYLYDAATGQYYGMFQWSKKWYPEAHGMSFEEQLDYYKETTYPVFKTWGSNYADGFTHDDFNRLESPRDAALAFAKIYERCADWTYERRQNFSEVAYEYFVLDFIDTDCSYDIC